MRHNIRELFAMRGLLSISLVLVFALVVMGLPNDVEAASDGASKRGEPKDPYSKTIGQFKSTWVGKQFFGSAYAYAVFPTVAKAGLGIGGAHGKGRVYIKGKKTGEATVTQISIGLQAGGQAYSQIVFMKDKRAYDEFTSGNFEVEAGLSAIAVNAHVGAQAGTTGASASSGLHPSETEQIETKYYKGMAVLTAGKGGLMYEASIAGQKYTFKPAGK